jgi:hypothetical protein
MADRSEWVAGHGRPATHDVLTGWSRLPSNRAVEAACGSRTDDPAAYDVGFEAERSRQRLVERLEPLAG